MMKFSLATFALSLMISVLLLLEPVRSRVQQIFNRSQREVLSSLEFKRGDQSYRIIKIKTGQGLALEVYKRLEEGDLLLDVANLADKRDASFKFAGKSANLFMQDISGDGIPDIISPSLDKNLKARLNVFLWNEQDEKLEKLTANQ